MQCRLLSCFGKKGSSEVAEIGRIIIQKFGGSSLVTGEQRRLVAKKLMKAKNEGYHVVAVFSAAGRYPDPYATDTLANLLAGECPEENLKDKDLIMSCGENLSCVAMASLLRSMGEKAVTLTGFGAGIITDNHFGEARVCAVDRKLLLSLLMEGNILCVTGFQGITDDGEITTLGRGGSDTTATVLGAVLGAEAVDIYTDVDGVMTIDPRVYPESRIVRQLSYQEMGEMANEGAKVLHSRSVDLSQEYDIPLRVRGTFSEDIGTIVSSKIPERAREKMITGLIHRTGIVEFILDLKVFQSKSEIRRALFERLAREKISLDLINVCYDSLYFIVAADDVSRAAATLASLSVPHERIENLAKISCVGIGMKGTPGVMARICKTLSDAGIVIYRSLDSFINISCLISESDLVPAIEALHRQFRLGEE
jgi:aspartate kinase